MFYFPYLYQPSYTYWVTNSYIMPNNNEDNISRQIIDAKEFVGSLSIYLSAPDKEIITRQVNTILQQLFFPEELQAVQKKLETYVNLGQIVPRTKIEAYQRINNVVQLVQEASALHSKAINISTLYFSFKAALGILIKKYAGQTFLPLGFMSQYFNEIVDFKIIEQVTSTDQFEKKSERLLQQIITEVLSRCAEIPD